MDTILIIDPGHGGKDLGGGSNGSFKEKDMNLQISLYQYKRFQELNLPVKLTREEDIYLSPTNRTSLVKDSGAKYCISNHINAATPAARGVETIHSIHSDGKLATALYEAIVEAGMIGRRVFSKESSANKGMDYYYMHRLTGSVETIIIEYGFATNAEDTKLILDYWEDYAEAVVKAFCNFIGHTYYPPLKVVKLPVLKQEVKVQIGETVLQAFLTEENVTMVEVRKLAQVLDLDVRWDSATNTVLIS